MNFVYLLLLKWGQTDFNSLISLYLTKALSITVLISITYIRSDPIFISRLSFNAINASNATNAINAIYASNAINAKIEGRSIADYPSGIF